MSREKHLSLNNHEKSTGKKTVAKTGDSRNLKHLYPLLNICLISFQLGQNCCKNLCMERNTKKKKKKRQIHPRFVKTGYMEGRLFSFYETYRDTYRAMKHG